MSECVFDFYKKQFYITAWVGGYELWNFEKTTQFQVSDNHW
jgi:hypothetical protein